MHKLLKLLLLLAAMLAAGPARAHGGHDHLMGTVTAADAGHVELKTVQGKVVSVRLDKDTKYAFQQTQGGAAPGAADLKPGVRVMIDTAGTGDKLVAKEVRIGARAPGASR